MQVGADAVAASKPESHDGPAEERGEQGGKVPSTQLPRNPAQHIEEDQRRVEDEERHIEEGEHICDCAYIWRPRGGASENCCNSSRGTGASLGMDSINQVQPEETRRDLDGQEAVEKIQEIVKHAETCFFCTASQVNGAQSARPMNVRKVDDNGDFWFLSAKDSKHNQEIASNPTVSIFLQGGPHSDFLHIVGTATISTARDEIDELWMPLIKVWFTEGKDDPRITVIKVTPTEGYYWDNKHGDFVASAKIMFGAMIGKTLDDSVEGTIVP